MDTKVKVGDIVEQLELAGPEVDACVNKKTGEIVTVAHDTAYALEVDDPEDLPEWLAKALPKMKEATESQDYVLLPSSFEIHEWQIMRDFAASYPDEPASEALLNAIHGRGAFRYFKAELHRLGAWRQWETYRWAALERIAIAWLERNGIPYEPGGGYPPSGTDPSG